MQTLPTPLSARARDVAPAEAVQLTGTERGEQLSIGCVWSHADRGSLSAGCRRAGGSDLRLGERRVGRRVLQRRTITASTSSSLIERWRPRPRIISQPIETAFDEPLAPVDHRRLIAADLVSD